MPISENMVQEIVQEVMAKSADRRCSGRKTWRFQGYE